MSTLTPPPPAPAPPQRVIRPSEPLDLPPSSQRRWRGALVALAILMLALTLGGLAVGSVLRAVESSRFTEIPATQGLGIPGTLEVTTDIGDVSVRTDPTAEEVTIRLLTDGDGASSPETVKARISVAPIPGVADGTSVRVTLPHHDGGFWWSGTSGDVELVVPASLAPTMDLDLTTDIGDVDVAGEFAAVQALTSTGGVDLDLGGITGEVSAISDLGDVDVRLGENSAPTAVTARTDTGEVTVRLPGTGGYRITAETDLGERVVDPSLVSGDGIPVTATSDLGDVTVGR